MKKNKNIWPYAIVASFVLFALFIGSMVKRSMDVSLNLESENYYEQEIAYEGKINRIKKARELGIEIREEEGKTVLWVGKKNTPSRVTVRFFRPSDSKMDLLKTYEIDQAEYAFNTDVLAKGKWVLRVELETPNGKAFVEKELMIE